MHTARTSGVIARGRWVGPLCIHVYLRKSDQQSFCIFLKDASWPTAKYLWHIFELLATWYIFMGIERLSFSTINKNRAAAELNLKSFEAALTNEMSDEASEMQVNAAYGLADSPGLVTPHEVQIFGRTFPILRKQVILKSGDVVTEFNVHDALESDSEDDISSKRIICQFYLIGHDAQQACLALNSDASSTDSFALVNGDLAPVLVDNIARQALESGVFSESAR